MSLFGPGGAQPHCLAVWNLGGEGRSYVRGPSGGWRESWIEEVDGIVALSMGRPRCLTNAVAV